MNQTTPVNPCPKSEFLQSEPIKYLMQDRNHEALETMADKIDLAMLWVVFNHEFVSNQEREFADIYAELRDARNFFRLLSRYVKDNQAGRPQ